MKRSNILILTVAFAAITGAFLASKVAADEPDYIRGGHGIAIAAGGSSVTISAPSGDGYACSAITGGALDCGGYTVIPVGTGDYGGPSSESCSFFDLSCGWLDAIFSFFGL